MPEILPALVRDALRRYAAALRERFGARVGEVRLFGSFARGEAGEESDVDVFVRLEALTSEDKRAALDLAADIGRDLDLRLSALVMDGALYRKWLRQERRLALDIAREGIPA